MKQRKWILPAALALLFVLAIVLGSSGLSRMFQSQVNEERKHQLEELTAQLSDTFKNALDFNRACVGTAANVFTEQEYASEEDLILAAGRISSTVLTEEEEEEEEEERVFALVDENGVCYDKNGRQGIWGDFDQIVDMGEYCTFISDSVNFEGVHWAFVRRLDEPVTTLDGEVTVCYVVLLKTVGSMGRYYASEAYEDVCETYVLKSNGTRMYDSVTEEDTISAYNVYKHLREEAESRGEAFDDTLQNLDKNKVACGNYTAEDGGEYIYSLAWQEEYDFVLLFLIPAGEVAANTMTMVTFMMRMFLFFGALLLFLGALALVFVMRLSASRKVAALKEKNLQDARTANERLAGVNASLMHANMAAENALDIARSANRAKSNFLSNMSHDIRTPLNAIIGFLQLLEKDADKPDKVLMYSRKIRVSSQHLLGLINDILDMSRIESGKTELNLKIFEIEGLIADVETVIRPQAMEKKQKFDIKVADAAKLPVQGDELKLTQILVNLLTNAVKYTPKGGSIRLTAEVVKRERKMATFRFTVKDNGIGMSPEFQKRVFDPFEREQTSTTSGVAGTGLGMAITKNLVTLMGGVIFVESEQGKGSTFTAELPLTVEEDDGQRTVDNGRRTADSGQWTAAGEQGSADSGQRPEDSGLGSEAGGQRPEAGGQWPVVSGRRTEASSQRSEAGEQRSEAGGQRSADSGRRSAAGEQGSAAGGQWSADRSRRTEASSQRSAGDSGRGKAAKQPEDILQGRHFLVAEDNEINAEIISELLAMEGASCVIASNGREALEKLQESEPGTFDAVFLDIQMPVMGGYEAARRIRASRHPDARTIPIAAMTANAFAEDVKKALDAGMNEHIPKPVDMQKIREFMRKCDAGEFL